MAFWSGETLAKALPGLVKPYDKQNLDCASYKLSVGEQAFVTSDKFEASPPSAPLVSMLQAPPNHTLVIRPGQFAFLLTEEVVTVPNNAIALISMRTTFKFKGLINVSGFHVDPGWSGKLLFSVYNAGPMPVIVERGQPMFLIVYADLDQVSAATYKGSTMGLGQSIPTPLLQNMTEQVFSPLMLQRRMEDLKSKMDRVEGTANTFKYVTVAVTTIVTILLAVAALFATFAPATLGVIIARMMDGGGYEMRLKPNDPPAPTSPPIKSNDRSKWDNSGVVTPAAVAASSSSVPAPLPSQQPALQPPGKE